MSGIYHSLKPGGQGDGYSPPPSIDVCIHANHDEEILTMLDPGYGMVLCIKCTKRLRYLLIFMS